MVYKLKYKPQHQITSQENISQKNVVEINELYDSYSNFKLTSSQSVLLNGSSSASSSSNYFLVLLAVFSYEISPSISMLSSSYFFISSSFSYSSISLSVIITNVSGKHHSSSLLILPFIRRTSLHNIQNIRPIAFLPLLLHGIAQSTQFNFVSLLQKPITGTFVYDDSNTT